MPLPYCRLLTLFLTALSALSLTACGGGGGGAAPGGPLSITNFMKASVVMGQDDFTTAIPDSGEKGLDSPYGNVASDGTKLFVTDFNNNRVVVFNTIPQGNGAAADSVLGQSSFLDVVPPSVPDATSMSAPLATVVTNNRLYIADYGNNRVLMWNTIPTNANANASVVIGQNSFNNSSKACSNTGLDSPQSIAASGNTLVVADTENHRVLIWTSPPTANTPANIVLGQADLTSCNANRNGSAARNTLSGPTGVWTDGTKLVVVDSYNHRVLIWNNFPTTDGQDADLVLGQNSFTRMTRNDVNQDGTADLIPSASTLSGPANGVDSDGTQLFVADTDNNRVLVWKTFPTANGQAADVVLGQSDFAHFAPNDDAQDGKSARPSERTLNKPAGVKLIGRQLFVSDTGNHRVLIFNL